VNAPVFPPPKTALDAMTDQCLAHVAAERRKRSDGVTRRSLVIADEVAQVIAEQFPEHREIAGRAVMCASQMLSGIVVRLQDAQADDSQIGPLVANIFAFAAEQVVREAGTE
jgi:hypothetical protein